MLRKFWNAIKSILPTKTKNKNSTSFTIDDVNKTHPAHISRTFCTYYSSVVGNLKNSMTIFGNLVWRESGNICIKLTVQSNLLLEYPEKFFVILKSQKK